MLRLKKSFCRPSSYLSFRGGFSCLSIGLGTRFGCFPISGEIFLKKLFSLIPLYGSWHPWKGFPDLREKNEADFAYIKEAFEIIEKNFP